MTPLEKPENFGYNEFFEAVTGHNVGYWVSQTEEKLIEPINAEMKRDMPRTLSNKIIVIYIGMVLLGLPRNLGY